MKGLDFDNNMFTDNFEIFFDGLNVYDLTLGRNHCLVLSENRELYVLGNNDLHELGYKRKKYEEKLYSENKFKTKKIKIKENENENFNVEFDIENLIMINLNHPVKHEFFEDKKIKKIVSGENHNMILLEDGSVFSFGNNSLEQCSNFEDPVKVPKLITYDKNLPKIIDIFAGAFHSGLINEEGDLYLWGDCLYNKLGIHLNKTSQNTPKLIPYFRGYYITQVGLFSQETVVITGSKENSIIEKNK